MSNILFSKRLSVSITDKMDELLDDIATSRTRRDKPVSKADLMREALRLYLDEQPDARGSRKQIAKSLEGQIVQLYEQLQVIQQHLDWQDKAREEQDQFLAKLREDLEPLIAFAKARKAT